MYEKEIGEYIYRIVTWEDFPRQAQEFMVIKSLVDYEKFDSWYDVKGFDKLKDAIKFINKLEATQ
jgi:hypothetical protein